MRSEKSMGGEIYGRGTLNDADIAASGNTGKLSSVASMPWLIEVVVDVGASRLTVCCLRGQE